MTIRTVRELMGVDIYVLERNASYKQIVTHNRSVGTPASQFASELARSLAVACVPTTEETSHGHQKIRQATPQEVVERSIIITSLLYPKLIEMGWVKEMPDLQFDDVISTGFTGNK